MLPRVESVSNATLQSLVYGSFECHDTLLVLFQQTQSCAYYLAGIVVASLRNFRLDKILEVRSECH